MRLGGALLCLVCGTPCGQMTFVMSLRHAVLRGLGGKCACVSPGHCGKERMLLQVVALEALSLYKAHRVSMFPADSQKVCEVWLRKGGVSVHFPPHAA